MKPTHGCANLNCEHIGWTLKQSPSHANIWRTQNSTHDFWVVANQPVCPICGDGLVRLIGLDELPNPALQNVLPMAA